MPRALLCGNLVSKKLVLRDVTQLKARYLCKANGSQSARRSRLNLKIHKLQLANHKEKEISDD